MKRILGVVLVCLLAVTAHATITWTVNLKEFTGTAVSARTKVVVTMNRCGSNIPRVAGTGVIVPLSKEFTPDATGAVSMTLYGKDEVICGGQTGIITYTVAIMRDGKLAYRADYSALTSGDITQMSPLTVVPTVEAPTGDNTYLRLDGGNAASLVDTIINGKDIKPSSVRIDPLDSMPGDPHGIISSLGARFEASDQDHRPIFYCTSTIGGPCVSIHSLDTTLGRATSYEKGDGGGGARLFQRTIDGVVCNLGAIGGYGAIAGIDTGKDDFAIGYDMADCAGASTDRALKFRSRSGDTWHLTYDGSWVPQTDSASITIGYGTGKGKLRISNSNGATISFYNLRDGAAWMTFDNGVVGVPAWMSAAGGLDTPRLQLTSLAGLVCNSSNKGTVNYVAGGAGVADTAKICLKDSADNYALQSIVTTIKANQSVRFGPTHAVGNVMCQTGAVAGNTCDNTFNWPVAFADANYTAVCSVSAVATGVPMVRVSTKSATQLVVTVVAITAAGAQPSEISCMAQHD